MQEMEKEIQKNMSAWHKKSSFEKCSMKQSNLRQRGVNTADKETLRLYSDKVSCKGNGGIRETKNLTGNI